MIEKLADLIERKEDNEEVDASITQKPKSVKKTSIQDNKESKQCSKSRRCLSESDRRNIGGIHIFLSFGLYITFPGLVTSQNTAKRSSDNA